MFDSFMLSTHYIQGSQIMARIAKDDVIFILENLLGAKVFYEANPKSMEDLYCVRNDDFGKIVIHTLHNSRQPIRNFIIGVCVQYYYILKYYGRDKITIRRIYIDDRENYNSDWNTLYLSEKK